MFHGHLGCFQTPPLGGRSNTKPGDHATPKSHSLWFILFYHEQRSASIEIHWNSIWLRAQSLMAAQYTWGSVTTLHEFGGVLGRPLDTFGLSQFHGHGSWLVCEVALVNVTLTISIRATSHMSQEPWLWEPQRKCPNAAQIHLQNLIVWCHPTVNQMLFQRISIHVGSHT